MKLLLAVPACHSDDWSGCDDWASYHNLSNRPSSAERVEAIRETWWNTVPFDKQFFYGTDVNAPDNLENLCQKVQAICRWALDREYDYLFRTDDDAFVFGDRLAKAAYQLTADQVGYIPSFEYRNYITGGAGYWLSSRAMKLIVEAEPNQRWKEDLWIGDILRRTDILRVKDDRYRPGLDSTDGHFVHPELIPQDNDYIALHSCTPSVMRQLYTRFYL